MNVLIVEDNEFKRDKIHLFLKESLSCIIREACSYHEALKLIINYHFDLIILDMSMPLDNLSEDNIEMTHDSFAGLEILDQMDMREIKTPVIVCTQFDVFDVGNKNITLDELKEKLLSDYPENCIGIVYYRSDLDQWKNKISELINKIRE